MRVFDVYEAVAREKFASGSGPRLAVGIRSFEAPYLGDLFLYRDSIDLCVTSGEFIADVAVAECGFPRERTVSIGGGVHSPLRPARVRRPDGAMRLLYAGRLDNEQKRILDLPTLLDELDRLGVDYIVDVAGTGPAEQALRERLAARIDGGSVVMHGWVPREALYESLYPAADVFLHFAAWEGMTIAPREAMAHGAVPVVSRFAGLEREGQFRDGETALTFPVGDVASAARCVSRLRLEGGLLEHLSIAAAQSQTGKYEFQGSMDAWAHAFDNCLARPAASGSLPVIPSRQDGRLSRWGIPHSLQGKLRDWLGLKVRHGSPGSEWPTASGLIDADLRRALDRHSTGPRAGTHE